MLQRRTVRVDKHKIVLLSDSPPMKRHGTIRHVPSPVPPEHSTGSQGYKKGAPVSRGHLSSFIMTLPKSTLFPKKSARGEIYKFIIFGTNQISRVGNSPAEFPRSQKLRSSTTLPKCLEKGRVAALDTRLPSISPPCRPPGAPSSRFLPRLPPPSQSSGRVPRSHAESHESGPQLAAPGRPPLFLSRSHPSILSPPPDPGVASYPRFRAISSRNSSNFLYLEFLETVMPNFRASARTRVISACVSLAAPFPAPPFPVFNRCLRK